MEGMPVSQSERISDQSEEYREIRERMRENVPFGARIFGEDLIAHIDSYRERIQEIENYLEGDAGENKKIERLDDKILFEKLINDMLLRFRADLKKQEYKRIIPFFKTVSTFPNIKQLVIDELPWIEKLEKFNETELSICVMDYEVSNDLFEVMVRCYVNYWENKEEEFHEKAPYMLAEFKEKALQAIRDNKLPITEEYLEERMGETRIYLGDNMRLGTCTGGDYNIQDGVVRVAYEEDENIQEKVVFHEMIHALAGRTVRFQNGNLDHQRSGLSFLVYNEQGKIKGRQFRWLDEAVTEEIAIELSGADPDNQSYILERMYLQDLYAQGVSMQLIYEAYFENYDPASQDKVPKWKELVRHIKDKQPDIDTNSGSVEYLKKVEEQISKIASLSRG